jgi:hypothetical protein
MNEAINLLALGEPTISRAWALIDTMQMEEEFAAYRSS